MAALIYNPCANIFDEFVRMVSPPVDKLIEISFNPYTPLISFEQKNLQRPIAQ